MRLRLVCEELDIDEVVEFEKYYGRGLMLKRQRPRRFYFSSGWGEENFRKNIRNTYTGYLKSVTTHYVANISVEEEE